MWSVIIFLCFIGVCNGIPPRLDVAWKYNHLLQQTFDSMPEWFHEATQLGFHKVGNCTDNPKFNGIPFRRPNDFAVTVLFDIKGLVAGMQITIPTSAVLLGEPLREPYILDGDRYVLTIYFIDPSIICTTGTPLSGLGTFQIFLQLSASPLSSIEIPLMETALDLGRWTKGQCVSELGRHYFLKTTDPTNCDVSTPIFIVFDSREQLFAFGHSLLYTNLYVASSVNAILKNMFIQAAPQCLQSPALFDFVYVFLSRKWVPNYCLLGS